MKVAIDVKSVNRMNNLSPNDILIFNGKVWEVTTKEALFAEEVEYLRKCEEELIKLKQDQLEFKKEVTKKIEAINEVLTHVVKGE